MDEKVKKGLCSRRQIQPRGRTKNVWRRRKATGGEAIETSAGPERSSSSPLGNCESGPAINIARLDHGRYSTLAAQ